MILNIVFLTNHLNAHEKFNFFGIELGIPLENENILTNERNGFLLSWEVIEPIIKNKTFNQYSITRGKLSKNVYGILVRGSQESFNWCIKDIFN